MFLRKKDFKVKEINKLFNNKYNIEIYDKQIIHIMYENRIKIKTNSYYYYELYDLIISNKNICTLCSSHNVNYLITN